MQKRYSVFKTIRMVLPLLIMLPHFSVHGSDYSKDEDMHYWREVMVQIWCQPDKKRGARYGSNEKCLSTYNKAFPTCWESSVNFVRYSSVKDKSKALSQRLLACADRAVDLEQSR